MPAKSSVNVPEVIIRVFFHKVKRRIVSVFCECVYATKPAMKRRCKSEWLATVKRAPKPAESRGRQALADWDILPLEFC